jgi:acetyl esterase/lipase
MLCSPLEPSLENREMSPIKTDLRPLVSPAMTTGCASVHRDISYASTAGKSGVGDLFLPAGEVRGCPVLLIHGGGWKALDKESIEFLVPFFLKAGRPVFNANYRLLGTAPWPACGADCLAAGRFILDGGMDLPGLPAPDKVLLCGASAGGHLAMMTGLSLPRERVEAVLSLAGPSRLDWLSSHPDPLGMHENFLESFFGRPVLPDSSEVRAASPALQEEKNPPRLFCLHSRNDRLVPLAHSQEVRAAWEAQGGTVDLTVIDGHGELHGFWIDNNREGELLPEVREFIRATLSQLP